MDPALPPEFPPQSTTPPLPTSFQNQRPAQHGWNDPPSTVFGAQAAKKRTPRATATSYLNPAHAPLPAHGAAQPYPDAVAQGHAHRGAYIGATNGTPGLQQTLAAPPPPVAAFPPASSPAVQMPAAPPAVSFPSVSPPVAAPPIAMAAPIVPPRIASIAPRSAPADIGGVEAALKKALEESRANNTDNTMKRILDDSERRLKSLYDKLARNALAPQVLSLLVELSQALEAKQKAAASQTAQTIVAAALAHSREGDDSGWSVGLKRLVVEAWAKVVPEATENAE